MDPSWSDVKCILKRHEEMVEANSSGLQQVSGKLGDLDQTIAILVQCIDNLEMECQQLRSLVLPQNSQSASINQASTVSRLGISEDKQRGWDVVPMDIEENTPSHGGVQEVPDNESSHH
jgi:hypothetical protein